MALMKFRESNQVAWYGSRPAHRGTQVVKSKVSQASTDIVHTVTSGKTLFLCGLIFSANTSAVDKTCKIFVRDDSDVLQYDFTAFTFRTTGVLSISLPFYPPLEIPAGYDIVTTSPDASAKCSGFIFGWEE